VEKRKAEVYLKSHCELPDYEREVEVENTCVVPFTDDPESYGSYECGGKIEWHKERIADHIVQELGECKDCGALYVV